MPIRSGAWALDSGGFTELSMNGQWQTSAMTYSSEARKYRDSIGGFQWAAIQDWMCEPLILQKTRSTVREHQRATIASYHLLRQLASDLNWLPVLQGWHNEDYLRHVDDYRASGVDLASLPLVGLGSVCRRQDTSGVELLIEELHAMGIKLHGFGFKIKGLRRAAEHLASADSMAWSFEARRSPPLPGHAHKSCANCLEYALWWREKVKRKLDSIKGRTRQPGLFDSRVVGP